MPSRRTIGDRYGVEFAFVTHTERPAVHRFRAWDKQSAFEKMLVTGVCLRGLEVEGVKFPEGSTRGVDLSYSRLTECCFDECDMRDANLSFASLVDCHFTKATFRRTKFDRVQVVRGGFRWTQMEWASWYMASLHPETVMGDGFTFLAYLARVVPNLLAVANVDVVDRPDPTPNETHRAQFLHELFDEPTRRWLGPRYEEFFRLFVDGVISGKYVIDQLRSIQATRRGE